MVYYSIILLVPELGVRLLGFLPLPLGQATVQASKREEEAATRGCSAFCSGGHDILTDKLQDDQILSLPLAMCHLGGHSLLRKREEKLATLVAAKALAKEAAHRM